MKKYYVGKGSTHIPMWVHKSLFKSLEIRFIWKFWWISLLLDPDPHSQYGSGSRRATSNADPDQKEEVLPELGVSCEGVVVGRPAEHQHPAHEQGTGQSEKYQRKECESVLRITIRARKLASSHGSNGVKKWKIIRVFKLFLGLVRQVSEKNKSIWNKLKQFFLCRSRPNDPTPLWIRIQIRIWTDFRNAAVIYRYVEINTDRAQLWHLRITVPEYIVLYFKYDSSPGPPGQWDGHQDGTVD